MIFRFLQAAVGLGAVALVVLKSHPDQLWQVLRAVDLQFCVAALALNLPVLLLTPLRSLLVLRSMGYRIPTAILIPSTILGFVAGGLTPAASGELLRAQALRSRAGLPLEPGITAVLFERALSLYLLLVTTGLILALRATGSEGQLVAVAAALLLCFLPWAAGAAGGRYLPAQDRLRSQRPVAGLLRRGLAFASQLRGLLSNGRLLIAFTAVSMAIFGLIGMQYWLLTKAAGIRLSLSDAWLVFGLSTFAGVVALIPLGLGVLDASLAAAVDRLGATLDQGSVVALLVRGLVTLPLVLMAFACYLYLQRLDILGSHRPAGVVRPGDQAGE